VNAATRRSRPRWTRAPRRARFLFLFALALALAQHPDLHGLRVTEATGAVRCGAGHVRTINVTGQGWFERVTRDGTSLAGEYRLGPTSGLPELVVAQVLAGPVPGVLSAAVDLDRSALLSVGGDLRTQRDGYVRNEA
jgi:hypothetical protein